MRLSELAVAARAHWIVLLVGAFLGLAAAGALAAVTTPTYESRSELVVIAQTGSSASDLAQSTDYLAKQVRTFSALATRPIVLDPVVHDLGLSTTSAELAGQMSVSNVLNTNIITIVATSTDPSTSASIANGVASSLQDVVSRLVPTSTDGTKSVQLRIVRPALMPAQASSPNAKVWLMLGGLAGLAAGAAFAAARVALDTKVRSVAQLEEVLQAPHIGTVRADRTSAALLDPQDTSSLRAEEYRQIRSNLMFLRSDDRSLFPITSSVAGEGKSTTSVNVALALSQAGANTCLVEADLRRPTLGAALGLEGFAGLTSVLIGRASVDDVLQPWGKDLHVMLSGPCPPNPSELLASSRMRALLAELGERFDYVIIDCPPLLPVTDALVVAHHCGGAIMVVGFGQVRRDNLRLARKRLETAGVSISGVVANLVRKSDREGYYTAATYSSRRHHRAVDPVDTIHTWSPPVAPTPTPHDAGDNGSHTVRQLPAVR